MKGLSYRLQLIMIAFLVLGFVKNRIKLIYTMSSSLGTTESIGKPFEMVHPKLPRDSSFSQSNGFSRHNFFPGILVHYICVFVVVSLYVGTGTAATVC